MNSEIVNRIKIQQDDITTLAVDAIVNAANTSLLGGGGVDGAIHRKAGLELLSECRKIGGCPTGEARITKGYQLKAKYIIHTVGPVYGKGGNSPELLQNCYENSLRLAVENNIKTIAFPAISCGVYGYPIQEACEIAIHTTIRFLTDHPSIQQVIFVLFSREYLDVYMDYFTSYSKNG